MNLVRLVSNINAPKMTVVCINTTLDEPITIAGETLECVDSFRKYDKYRFEGTK